MLEPRRTRRHCDWERAKGGREGGGGGALALNGIDFRISLAPSFTLSCSLLRSLPRVCPARVSRPPMKGAIPVRLFVSRV